MAIWLYSLLALLAGALVLLVSWKKTPKVDSGLEKSSPMRNFLENINMPGGHIMVLLFIGILASFGHKWGIPKMDEVVHDSFVAILSILSYKGLDKLVPKDPPSAN